MERTRAFDQAKAFDYLGDQGRFLLRGGDTHVREFDLEGGDHDCARSLYSGSAGVMAQRALRDGAGDDGSTEENLWTGIGRARSGCGAALVGDPDQIVAKLQAYVDLGIEAFILSGYPHKEECDLFAKYVLPRLDHAKLA